MDTKFNSRTSFTSLLRNGISSNLKSVDGIKDILKTRNNSKKYIVTLKSKEKSSTCEVQLETGKPNMNTHNAPPSPKEKQVARPRITSRALRQVSSKVQSGLPLTAAKATTDPKPCHWRTSSHRLSAGCGLDNKKRPEDKKKKMPKVEKSGVQFSSSEMNNSEESHSEYEIPEPRLDSSENSLPNGNTSSVADNEANLNNSVGKSSFSTYIKEATASTDEDKANSRNLSEILESFSEDKLSEETVGIAEDKANASDLDKVAETSSQDQINSNNVKANPNNFNKVAETSSQDQINSNNVKANSNNLSKVAVTSSEDQINSNNVDKVIGISSEEKLPEETAGIAEDKANASDLKKLIEISPEEKFSEETVGLAGDNAKLDNLNKVRESSSEDKVNNSNNVDKVIGNSSEEKLPEETVGLAEDKANASDLKQVIELSPEKQLSAETAGLAEGKANLDNLNKVKESSSEDKVNNSNNVNKPIGISFEEKLPEETTRNDDKRKFVISPKNSRIENNVPLKEEAALRQRTQVKQPANINQDVKAELDILHLSPSEEFFCRRIDNLEKQVYQINSGLKEIRSELVPEEDLIKLNTLLKRFGEINDLFDELKINCLDVKNMEATMNQDTEPLGPNAPNGPNGPTRNGHMHTKRDKRPNRILNFHDKVDVYSGPDSYVELCNCKIHQRLKFNSAENYQNTRLQPIQENTTTESEFSLLNAQKNVSEMTFFLPKVRKQSSRNRQSKHLQHSNHNVELRSVSTSMSSKVKETTKTAGDIAEEEYFQNTLTSSDSSTTSDASVSSNNSLLPVITSNLTKAIWKIIGNQRASNIALTLFMETNDLYHINVSTIQTGECLGCVYSNEAALNQAKRKKFLDQFLVFIVLNPENSLDQRDKISRFSSFNFNKLGT